MSLFGAGGSESVSLRPVTSWPRGLLRSGSRRCVGRYHQSFRSIRKDLLYKPWVPQQGSYRLFAVLRGLYLSFPQPLPRLRFTEEADLTLRIVLVLFTGLACSYASLTAQDIYTLSGRVVEEGSSNEIPSASVEIENQEIVGTVPTQPNGSFQFDGLRPGGYTLRVLALGYTPKSLYVVVDEDLALEIPMSISPLSLDTLAVGGESIDVSGTVVKAGTDLALASADVLTDQGVASRTDGNGRFDLEGIYADVPLLIVVRAFGYRPLAATLIPEEGEDYRLELQQDSAVQEAIRTEVARIEERAKSYPSILRAMGSERLEELADLTLRDALRIENGGEHLDRVRCWIIDGRPLSSWAAGIFLDTTVPQEVQRIEFLSAPANPDFVMGRIYTNQFMRRMLASDMELRRPAFMQPSTGRIEVDQSREYRTFQPAPEILHNRSDEPPSPLCL